MLHPAGYEASDYLSSLLHDDDASDKVAQIRGGLIHKEG